jgi:cytochrome c2
VSASVENGARIFRRCQSCHTVDEGGRNMVGPNLHGVFGREAGHKEDFRYSPAMSRIRHRLERGNAGRLSDQSARIHPAQPHELRRSA